MNIHESSLSRILQHVNSPNTTLAVISAFLEPERLKKAENLYTIPNRGEAQQINLRRHENLRDDIRADGLGYIEVDSGWAYEDVPGIHEEKAYFIPNISKERARQLCERYNQDCVLFKDNTGFYLMDKKGEKGMEFGKPGKTGIVTSLPGYPSEKGQTFGLPTKRSPRLAYEKLYTANLIKKGFSALIRANKSQKGGKFSFIGKKEKLDVRESLIGLDMGKMPKTKKERL